MQQQHGREARTPMANQRRLAGWLAGWLVWSCALLGAVATTGGDWLAAAGWLADARLFRVQEGAASERRAADLCGSSSGIIIQRHHDENCAVVPLPFAWTAGRCCILHHRIKQASLTVTKRLAGSDRPIE